MANVLYSHFLIFSPAFFLYGLRSKLHIHFCRYTQVNKILLSSLRKTVGFEIEYRNSIQTKCWDLSLYERNSCADVMTSDLLGGANKPWKGSKLQPKSLERRYHAWTCKVGYKERQYIDPCVQCINTNMMCTLLPLFKIYTCFVNTQSAN